MHKQKRLPGNWSILHVIFIGLIVVQSLLVGFVMLSQQVWGKEILLSYSRDMMRRLADGAISNTDCHLKPAEDVATITSDLIKSGILSPSEPEKLEKYLLETLQSNTSFAGLFYGSDKGDFLFVTRDTPCPKKGYLSKFIGHDTGKRVVEQVKRDKSFHLLKRQNIQDDYDPRARPWFDAYRQNSKMWTEPYIFFTSKKPGITVSVPVVGIDSRPIGAFGVDIEIQSLSDFLAHRQISPNATAFIIANNGRLVAHTSFDRLKKNDSNGKAHLVHADSVDNDAVLTTLWPLTQEVPPAHLQSGKIIACNVGGEKYIAMLKSFPENREWPWLMVVAAPEEDFIGTLQAARNKQIIQALLFSILITLVIFVAAARFLRPVRKALLQVHIDTLTELLTRKAFFEFANQITEKAKLEKQTLAIAMIDLDNFKQVNDTHGHLIGDEVLSAVAGRMRSSINNQDILGRYGGEEFIAIFVDTDPKQAFRVCERLRKSISDSPIKTKAGPITVTVSIGVAIVPLETASLEKTIDRADKALLTAKLMGKNQVVLADKTSTEA